MTTAGYAYAVYKFANLSRKEVEAMLGIKLEETRVYQEAKQEGLEQGLQQGREEGRKEGRKEGREEGRKEGRELAKLELIPRCLAYGISIEEVARLLHLTIEEVEQVRLANEQESSTST